ncbi:MAG: hypothetical protein E5W40_11935 [Mesorhizobium sp.]|nr:MAG: hypothetical protein E5W40_11935 [Mesorhizobium sp.]
MTTADGRVVAQEDLVGAVLTIGDGQDRVPLRIDAVEIDPRNPDGEIMLYTMSARDAASGAWRNICEPDIEGRRMGFPLAGTWTAAAICRPTRRSALPALAAPRRNACALDIGLGRRRRTAHRCGIIIKHAPA